MMFEALWRSVWADNTVPGKTIVLVILALLAWALDADSRHLKRYRREGVNLERIIRKLQVGDNPQPAPSEEGGEPATAFDPAEEIPVGSHVSPADLAELRKELDPD